MKRNLLEKLIIWNKYNPDNKPCIVNGMRGVGKTRLVYDFANENFPTHLYFNFERDQKVIDLFSSDVDLTKARIAQYFNLDIDYSVTLLVLDEFIVSFNAIEFINKLFEENHNIKVIATYSFNPNIGSLKNSYDTNIYPINKSIKSFTLYPMTFDEYLIAIGYEWYAEAIKEHFNSNKPLPDIVHSELLDLFNEYMYVGGFPDTVNEYIIERNFININEKHHAIVNNILMNASMNIDNGKYIKLTSVYSTLPSQLMKENKKFMFSQIRKGATYKIYEEEISALSNLGLFNLVKKLEAPSDFRAYLCDAGLLFSLANGKYNEVFLESLVENYVCQTLVSNGYLPRYWESKSQAKINFLIFKDGKLVPIEVKNSDDTRSKNYSVFKEFYPNASSLIKVSSKNFSYSKGVKFIPIYSVFCI